MKVTNLILACLAALAVIAAFVWIAPYVFAGRAFVGARVGELEVAGFAPDDLLSVLEHYEKSLQTREVPVTLREKTAELSLADLGVSLDIARTGQAALAPPRLPLLTGMSVRPIFRISEPDLRRQIEQEFQSVIQPPRNASLAATSSALTLVPAKPGESVNVSLLEQDIVRYLETNAPSPIPLYIESTPPRVTDDEVSRARELGERLLKDGLELRFEEQSFQLPAGTIARLMDFTEQVDPQNPENRILGLRLEPGELRRYLENTIEPAINQKAVNARLTLSEVEGSEVEGFETLRVTQFAAPQRGQVLNQDATALRIAQTITSLPSTRQERPVTVDLVVDIEQPIVAENADLETLGITTRLAGGESSFAGSPANRVHNIRVGASRYHGLVIPPGEEFSFNQHLGPVSAAAGFRPELVIKQNVTVPEYGGGLCQVSTTAFRAAASSGLEITERKSHSYAVRYYGTPGFDATIYPGYTDLRFRNNTPGHILIQARVDGTKLIFDFWGTDDGRKVEIAGPNPYSRQPNGAVKATLQQRVVKDNEIIIDAEFYSNYKSPALFPRATAEAPPVSPGPPA